MWRMSNAQTLIFIAAAVAMVAAAVRRRSTGPRAPPAPATAKVTANSAKGDYLSRYFRKPSKSPIIR